MTKNEKQELTVELARLEARAEALLSCGVTPPETETARIAEVKAMLNAAPESKARTYAERLFGKAELTIGDTVTYGQLIERGGLFAIYNLPSVIRNMIWQGYELSHTQGDKPLVNGYRDNETRITFNGMNEERVARYKENVKKIETRNRNRAH